MRYLSLPPLERPVSRLVLGLTAGGGVLGELLDRFVALGGNAIDTARWYGEEPLLGEWLAGRPDRDDLVVIGKGCHPADGYTRARVEPGALAADLEASLAALRTDWLDVYLLHRDDPGVSPGPLLEALAAERRAGRVRAYGASNWTVERLAEADAWAARAGVPPFAASSPQLSLATPAQPPWPGCVSAADARSRAWYGARGMPLIAWSSLARGWFARDDAARPAADRVWDTPTNRERRRRARAVGAQRGASATQVALAWLLAQPLHAFAVVGPRSTGELDECTAAVQLELDPDELGWLEAAPADA